MQQLSLNMPSLPYYVNLWEDSRIRDIVQISAHQCEFVNGRGTTDAALRSLVINHAEKRSPLHLTYIHASMWEGVQQSSLQAQSPIHTIEKSPCSWKVHPIENGDDLKTSVRTEVDIIEKFAMKVGVHQENALSHRKIMACIRGKMYPIGATDKISSPEQIEAGQRILLQPWPPRDNAEKKK